MGVIYFKVGIEEPLNNLKYKDDLQAFIIHAQITKAFNKSEEGSLESSNGPVSNQPTIILEETKTPPFQRMMNLT